MAPLNINTFIQSPRGSSVRGGFSAFSEMTETTRSPPTSLASALSINSTDSTGSNKSSNTNSPEHVSTINNLKTENQTAINLKNMLKKKKKQNIGVIGGSGPEAGVNVVSTIISIYKDRAGKAYKNDTDAPNVTLMQHSGVGGPHGYWDLGDMSSDAYQNLWAEMTDTILKLEMIGASCFCITCNTLHALEPELRKWLKKRNSKIQFVSIIESTQQAILKDNESKKSSNNNSNPTRIGMLGSYFTTGVTEDSPYRNLAPKGCEELEFAEINKDERNRLQELINETKRCGPLPELQDAFFNFVVDNFLEDMLMAIPEDQEVNMDCEELEVAKPDELLADNDEFCPSNSRLSCQEENANLENPMFINNKKATCDYLVLGCTELPLLLTEEKRVLLTETFGVNVIDPNATLAETLLRKCEYLREFESDSCKNSANANNKNASIAPKKPTKTLVSEDVVDRAADRNMASWNPFVSEGASVAGGITAFGSIANSASTGNPFGGNRIADTELSMNAVLEANAKDFGTGTTAAEGDFFMRNAGSNIDQGISPIGKTASPFATYSMAPAPTNNPAIPNLTTGSASSSSNRFFAPECGYLSDINKESSSVKFEEAERPNGRSSSKDISDVFGLSDRAVVSASTSKNTTASDVEDSAETQSSNMPAFRKQNSLTVPQNSLSKTFIEKFYGLKTNKEGSGHFGSCTDLQSTTCGGKSTAVSLQSNRSCASLSEADQHVPLYQKIDYEDFVADDDVEDDDDNEDEELQEQFELNDKIIYGKYGNIITNNVANSSVADGQTKVPSKDRIKLPKDSLESRMRNKIFM